jgi:hypothetical protein
MIDDVIREQGMKTRTSLIERTVRYQRDEELDDRDRSANAKRYRVDHNGALVEVVPPLTTTSTTSSSSSIENKDKYINGDEDKADRSETDTDTERPALSKIPGRKKRDYRGSLIGDGYVERFRWSRSAGTFATDTDPNGIFVLTELHITHDIIFVFGLV